MPREKNGLIALNACRFVDRMRIDASGLHIAFGTNDKEGCGLMQFVKTLKIEIASIHDVEGSGLCRQCVEDIDIVNFAIGDLDEGWNRASQV